MGWTSPDSSLHRDAPDGGEGGEGQVRGQQAADGSAEGQGQGQEVAKTLFMHLNDFAIYVQSAKNDKYRVVQNECGILRLLAEYYTYTYCPRTVTSPPTSHKETTYEWQQSKEACDGRWVMSRDPNPIKDSHSHRYPMDTLCFVGSYSNYQVVWLP